jgi:hypothetical protein
MEASRMRLDTLGATMAQALEPFGPGISTLAELGRQAIARNH